MRKVFGIGMPRTGTTTLQAALRLLGYRARKVVPGPPLWDNPFIQRYLAEDNAYMDYPWILLIPELYAVYPDAYFIVTTRDSASWIKSCQQHFGRTSSMARQWMFGKHYGDPYIDPQVWINKFWNHYNKIDALHIPDDQIVWMHISEGWGPICNLLDREIPNKEWPWLNKSTEKEVV